MTKHAYITGKVEYREGDGPSIVIRPGPCEVEEGEIDVTISWTEGEARGVAAITMADYRRYLAEGALRPMAEEPS